MKTKSILVMAVLLAIATTSCMQNPEGEKVKSGEATEISFPKDASILNPNLELSQIEWLGTKPTGTHYGTLAIKDGKLYLKDGKLLGGEFTLDMNSIIVDDIEAPEMNANLVGHLKSADFFAVDSFPTANFKFASVTAIEGVANNEDNITPTHRIEGNLTIKGITRKVNFPAKIEISDLTIHAQTPQFVINRTDWNVNYGSKSVFDNLKDNFIHDDIGIKITLKTK